jgi:hypothetical protein
MAMKVLFNSSGMRIQLILAVLAAGQVQAAELELKPETLKAWDEYVDKANLAMKRRCHGSSAFLWVDGNQGRMARVRAGEIVVWSTDETSPMRVPSGLIHDWTGAAFVPGARIDDVLSVVRDYARYKDVYRPGVLDAKLLRQTGGDDQFSMLVRNGSFFTKTALDGEYKSSYVELDEKRWYSFSCATRMQEIENFGQPGEHKLPPDEGHGYIWRMCSLSQLEERDGGVYVDEEMMVLSRDLPSAMRWMAGPIIRRAARETLAASIERTRIAVGSQANAPRLAVKAPRGVNGLGGCNRAGTMGCLR